MLDNNLSFTSELVATPIPSTEISSSKSEDNYYNDLQEISGDQTFIISLGNITFNADSFSLFIEYIADKVPELLLLNFIKKLNKWANEYNISWAEISFKKV